MSNETEYTLENVLSPIIETIKELIIVHKNDPLKPKPIIAVSGCKGVGKSYFTCTLEELLRKEDHSPIIIKQNGFIPFNETAQQGLFHIEPRLRWLDVHDVLEKIKNKTPEVAIPFRNKSSSPFSIEYQQTNFRDIELVIFDGTFSLTGPESYNFFSHATLGIFLEPSERDIATWRWQRHSKKPIEAQKTKTQFDLDLAKDMEIYHSYILPTKKNASFVIYKDENHRYTVESSRRPGFTSD